MNDDLSRIRRFILALTRRERTLLLLRVASYVALVGVVTLILLVAAAAGRWERSFAIASLVLALGVGGWAAVVVPLAREWRRTGDALRQAHLVEGLAPELRGRLLTAVERTGGVRGQESPELLALVARRAQERLGRVDPGAVHPARKVLRLALTTAALGLASLVFAIVAPGGPAGTWRWWFAGGSARAAVDVASFEVDAEHARVGDLVLEYTYPDYTGLEPVTVNNSTGDAHGPPGTRVRVLARAADPVEAAALVAYDEPALDAEVGADRRSMSGSFTIRAEEGFYHLVTYQDGSPLSSRPFTIAPEPDLPPDVTVEAEADVLQVALDEPIRLTWRARDDFGIARVALSIDGREHDRPLGSPRGQAEAVGEVGTRPAALGLQAGDHVKLRVVAWDNDTYMGSKSGRSRVIEVVVLGARGVDQRSAERQEALRDQMLVVLADHLEEPWPVSRVQDALADWGMRLATRYEPLEEAIAEFWTGMTVGSLENDVVAKVQRTGRELIRYTQVAFVPGSTEVATATELGVTTDLRDKAVVALEDGILALDRMLRMQALRLLSQDAKELATTAQNLREMMEGDLAPDELLSRLDKLERALEQLAQSATRLDEGGLKEFVNQRQSEMKSLMDEIRKAVAEGRTDDARELMAQLERQIQQMADGIQDNLEQMMSQESDAMAQAQALEERLEQIEERQLALQEEVRELRERSDATTAEKAESLWEEIDRRAGQLVERGQGYGKGLRDAGRTFNEEEVARAAADQLQHLAESSTARDLNGVRQAIPQAQMDWRRVESRLERLEVMSGPQRKGPGRPEIAVIQRELLEIEALVRQLDEMSRRVSPETAKQVREQREQQQSLQQELGEARQQARQLSREFPVRPEGMEESLEGADQQMGQAGDDLSRGQPMQAEGAQEMAAQGVRDARESLRRAMEQAQQQAQQLQSGEQASGEGSGEQRDQGERDPRMELPSPEEFRTPEEYRRALLEGMEGDVPEEYRALKKRYYEELVHQ